MLLDDAVYLRGVWFKRDDNGRYPGVAPLPV